MEIRKLLIADTSEDFRTALSEALTGTYIVRACADGPEAMRILRSFQPDVLVLDLMLPGKDGISLLQEAAEADIRPMVLATSRFVSEYVMDAIGKLGVEYILRKPCEIRATVARIRDLSCRLNAIQISQKEPKAFVSNVLQTLGIPAKLDGYGYLREAIPLMAKDPTQSITKELYPAVAKIFHCEPKNVERSIRSAIDAAWKKRDERIWRLYFHPDASGGVARPTNAGFICTLANSRELSGERNYGIYDFCPKYAEGH